MLMPPASEEISERARARARWFPWELLRKIESLIFPRENVENQSGKRGTVSATLAPGEGRNLDSQKHSKTRSRQ